MNDDAGSDREQDHLYDRKEHCRRIDGDPLVGEEVHQGRRNERRQQCRARSDRDRKRDISASQESDQVRSRTPGNTAKEHQTDSQIRRQRKSLAEREGYQRHDEELRENADEDILGAAEDFTEVGRREREPHAEHHDAEENRNPAANGLEHVRENKTQYPRNNHPQRKGLVGEAAKHK